MKISNEKKALIGQKAHTFIIEPAGTIPAFFSPTELGNTVTAETMPVHSANVYTETDKTCK